MSKTGDPPNPELDKAEAPPKALSDGTPDGLSEGLSEGMAATHRILAAQLDGLRATARRLVYSQKGRLPSQKRDQIEDLSWDIFQSTAAKVIEKGDNYKPELPFEAWFYGWAVLELNHHLQKSIGRSKKHKSVHFTDGAELSVVDYREGGSAQDVIDDMNLQEVTQIVLGELKKVLDHEEMELYLDKFYRFKDNDELASSRGLDKKIIAVKTTRLKQKVAQAFASQRGHDLLYGADSNPKEGSPLSSGARS